MNARRFLITGGFGFLGSALTRGLLQNGHKVRVLDNETRGDGRRLEDIQHLLEKVIRADIRNPNAFDDSLHDVDCVCHLAYINGTEFFYSMPETILDVAVRGMTNVLDACLRFNVQDFVLASSSEVYQAAARVPTDESAPLVVPDPLNPRYSYGGGKIISELMTLNFGRRHFRRAIVFRPHNVFGPDMGWEHVVPQFALRMHRLALEQPQGVIAFPIRGDGSATRSFIYIDDFTTGLLRVIERGEHMNIYNIGTMREISVAELATRIARCFGREIVIVPGEPVPGEAPRRCPDIAKLQRLGFTPRRDFQEALETTVRWYGEHAYLAPQHVSGTNVRNVI